MGFGASGFPGEVAPSLHRKAGQGLPAVSWCCRPWQTRVECLGTKGFTGLIILVSSLQKASRSMLWLDIDFVLKHRELKFEPLCQTLNMVSVGSSWGFRSQVR